MKDLLAPLRKPEQGDQACEMISLVGESVRSHPDLPSTTRNRPVPSSAATATELGELSRNASCSDVSSPVRIRLRAVLKTLPRRRIVCLRLYDPLRSLSYFVDLQAEAENSKFGV